MYEGNQAGTATEAYQGMGLMKAAQQLMQPTKRQQLQSRKDSLEAQLAKVNAALAALDEHPDLEKFLNTILQAEY